MSLFQLKHHNEVAFTIGEWIRLNPDLKEEHIQSITNDLISYSEPIIEILIVGCLIMRFKKSRETI